MGGRLIIFYKSHNIVVSIFESYKVYFNFVKTHWIVELVLFLATVVVCDLSLAKF